MRTWLVIPVVGVVATGTAMAFGAGGPQAPCAGLAAAAIAHAVRVLAGSTPAALVGAVLAALLAIVSTIEHVGVEHLAMPWLAIAAAAWTFAELARATASPLVGLVPATLATILEPGCASLIALVGARLFWAPRRPRWTIAVPLVGALAVILAIVAGSARAGAFASLGEHWYGTAPHSVAPSAAFGALGDTVGPLLAVAALAGFGLLVRVHLANLAIIACAAGALLVDVRAGTPGPTTLGLAALCAGIAIGRLAGTIRLAPGQAIVGAVCGAMLLLPPAWAAILSASR